MRQHLRELCHEIWVIDCSPEGHQPETATRIFQGVQQPVCIVLATRHVGVPKTGPAHVKWISLPEGHRNLKFEALGALTLSGTSWQDCPTNGRSPFLPMSSGTWTAFPRLEDLFIYNGTGVMSGRTWVIAPDAESLQQRWARLIAATEGEKERLFHPHLRNGNPGDKHSHKVVREGLGSFLASPIAVADEYSSNAQTTRYAVRSFDRQWIIADARLLNQPNPTLWQSLGQQQVFITAPQDREPTGGPALTCCCLIPDVHHYNGRGGRAFPLWADAEGSKSNLRPELLGHLSTVYGMPVVAEDLFAYIVAVAAHPAYVARFRIDLATPGLRVPLTADAATFSAAVELGRRAVWLQTYGERFADANAGRDLGPPRLPIGRRPQVPKGGAIPSDVAGMPDTMAYDEASQRLYLGSGYIESVPRAVWVYEVSGKQILTQWFSYRKKNRERPIIGDRRKPSPLGDIQPETWLAEYTTELLNVLNVLGLIVDMEPDQAQLLGRICDGPLVESSALQDIGVFGSTAVPKHKVAKAQTGPDLLTDVPSLGS